MSWHYGGLLKQKGLFLFFDIFRFVFWFWLVLFVLVFTSSSASLGSFQGGFPGAELRARRGIDPIGFLLGLGCRQRAVWGQDQLPPLLSTPPMASPPPWDAAQPGASQSTIEKLPVAPLHQALLQRGLSIALPPSSTFWGGGFKKDLASR